MKVRFKDLQEKYGDVCLMFDVVPQRYIDKWGHMEVKMGDVFDIEYNYPEFIHALKLRQINLEGMTFTFKELFDLSKAYWCFRDRLEDILYDMIYDGEIDFELEIDKDFIEFLYKKYGGGKRSFVSQFLRAIDEPEVIFEAAKHVGLKEVKDFQSVDDFHYACDATDLEWATQCALEVRISNFKKDRMIEAVLQMAKRHMELR